MLFLKQKAKTKNSQIPSSEQQHKPYRIPGKITIDMFSLGNNY